MARAAYALIAVLFILPSVLAVSGPNPRSPDLSTEGTINDLDVAGDSGHVLVVTQDTGSSTSGQPRKDVWYVFDARGSQVTAGHADHPDCGEAARLLDNCQSHATQGAISRDGTKIVVASGIPDLDGDVTRIVIGRPAAGTTGGFFLNGTVVDLDLSDDGTKLAILTHITKNTLTKSMVHYRVLSGTSVASTGNWDRYIDSAAHDLDLSGDGKVVVVGADRLPNSSGGTNYYRYTQGGSVAKNSDYGGAATAVSVSDTGSTHWITVGYSTGEVALFQDGATLAEFVRKPTTNSIRSVHMARDGSAYVAGDEAGRIHLFAVTPSATVRGSFLKTTSVGSGAVEDLSLSDDADLLLYRLKSIVSMDLVDGSALDRLWTATLTGTVAGLAMTGDGEQAAVAYGTTVRVFEASHTIKTTAPADFTLRPGATKTVTFTVENTGNRPETLDLQSGFDATALVALVDPASAALGPGDSTSVEVKITVLGYTGPGDYEVSLNHTLGSGGEGAGTVKVTVPTVHDLRLLEGASTSLGIDPGAAVPFQVFVRNEGNVEEAATVQVASTTPGWTASLDPSTVTVAPEEEGPVTVTLQAPAGAQQGDTGQVTVRLQQDAGQAVTLYGTVGARFEVGLSVPAGVEVLAGNSTTATVTVQNLGNAPDDFTLTLDTRSMPTGWSARFITGQSTYDTGSVPAGGNAEATVLIKAPTTVSASTQFVLGIDAVSQGDAAADAHKDLVVSVATPTVTTTTTTEANGTPFPGLVGALALLAGVALVRRRR